MPHLYDRLGVQFMYPDSWSLDEGEAFAERNAVTVFHPQGAFWSLAIYPPDDDLAERLSEAVLALREEYPQLDAERVQEPLAGHVLSGYDVDFFYLDFINTAMIRGVQSPVGTLVIVCQAEDREYDDLEPVFRAITISLLRGIPVPK